MCETCIAEPVAAAAAGGPTELRARAAEALAAAKRDEQLGDLARRVDVAARRLGAFMAGDGVTAVLALGPVRVVGGRLATRQVTREAMRLALARDALVARPAVVIEAAVEAVE